MLINELPTKKAADCSGLCYLCLTSDRKQSIQNKCREHNFRGMTHDKGRVLSRPTHAMFSRHRWPLISRKSGNISTNNPVADRELGTSSFSYLSPGAGHRHDDLTIENVRFFSIYSYLIAYRTETRPLQRGAIFHGRRDLEQILTNRL